MRPEKFLKAYERAPEPEAPKNKFHEIVHPLEQASHRLGEWVYTFLEQPPMPDGKLTGLTMCPPAENRPPTFDKDFKRYYDWQKGSHIPNELKDLRTETIRDVREALETKHMTHERAVEHALDLDAEYEEAMRKVTFHELTANMHPMYKPLLDGEWPKPGPNNHDKFWWITRVQQDIAGYAVRALEGRRQQAAMDGDMNYFSPLLGNKRSTVEGRGTEFDVAINLLEIAKQAMLEDPTLELTVIPAPPQFEATDFRRLATERGESEPKNPNVDFLIINLRTHEVVGAQVKARRRAKIARQYDTDERVVMQYGTDLGNNIRIKVPAPVENDEETSSASPAEKTFTWSGSLSVAMATDLQTYGPDAALVGRGSNRRADLKGNMLPPLSRERNPNFYPIINKFIARNLAQNSRGTDWVASLKEAAKKPGAHTILRRVGYDPDPYGFFGPEQSDN